MLCQPINLYPRLFTASVQFQPIKLVSHKWMNEIIRLSPKLTGTVYFSINWLDTHTIDQTQNDLRCLDGQNYSLTQVILLPKKMDFQQPRIYIVYNRRFIRNNFDQTN